MRHDSCRSNLASTFIVDPVRPNGFKGHIDQARNCPFRLSDDVMSDDVMGFYIIAKIAKLANLATLITTE